MYPESEGESFIRTLATTLSQRLSTKQRAKTHRRFMKVLIGRSHKRLVRFGLLAVNMAVLAGVILLVSGNQSSGAETRQNAVAIGKETTALSPLDQLSSADIAAHAAQVVALPEVRAVENFADTFDTQLSTAASSDTAIIAKPQAVSGEVKTLKDIASYTVVAGDTVSSIAEKFGVNADSVRWSNGLYGNSVDIGKVLTIPPINGIVYTVKDGDTIDSLAQKYSADKNTIIEFNDTELSGLRVGEKIVIPNGVQAAARTSVSSSTSSSFSWGGYSAVYGGNGYAYGYCTWWAANRRIESGRPIPSNFGHAISWKANSQRAGFAGGSTPQAGAVIWFPMGGLGHVGYVESVNADGSVNISDMNWGGWNRVTYRVIPAAEAGRYYYIY